MHPVDLVGIFGADAVPPELRGFVYFQANVEDRVLTGKEQVAILVVRNTESHITVFMDKLERVEDLEVRLKNQEAFLSEDARATILRAMGQ
jgi:hypothetical protein